MKFERYLWKLKWLIWKLKLYCWRYEEFIIISLFVITSYVALYLINN